MSSAYAKAKLKESRDAIQRKDWSAAREAAESVLESEADNYNATVFLALALLNEEQHAKAEETYLKAIELQPTQPLAIQGLQKLYEQRQDWAKLVELLRKQADVHLANGDATKCGECVQRIIEIQKSEGARSQRADALSLALPTSKYYDLLRTLPEPEPTAPLSTTTFEIQMAIHLESLRTTKEVIELLEYIEQDTVDKEVEKKRMRIEGAGKTRDVLRNEAGVPVWSQSTLPLRYEEILAHPDASDQDRRDAEAKLLRYLHRLLLALPARQAPSQGPTGTAAVATRTSDAEGEAMALKAQCRDRLAEMCRGMVLVGVPDELAWTIHLEWQDIASLDQLPLHHLRSFMHHFPRSGMSMAFRALLLLVRDEQFLREAEEARKVADIDHGVVDDDPLVQVAGALESRPDSLLVGRIAARLHLLDHDFVTVSDIASNALKVLSNLQQDAAVSLPDTERDLTGVRAIALSRSARSQDHVMSMRLLDLVLEHGEDAEILLARGSLESHAGRWESAKSLFARCKDWCLSHTTASDAEKLLRLHRDPVTQARAEVAWCNVQLNDLESADDELSHVIEAMDNDPEQAFGDEDRARAWHRWGVCALRLAQKNGSAFTLAFERYITSLKRSPSFAPTFSALGEYYETYQDPLDSVRSTKCYQKAFELDSTQSIAAFKLASHYATEREWDLVAMIAKRVVDGEGGAAALGGQTAAMRKHKTSNVWAWKAIGSVRLQKGDPEDAITPLQVALRSSADDAVTWQRLGEAYARTGRYAAALKAFDRAYVLDNASWQSQYSIADVKRELGDYDEAIEILLEIGASRPTESGVTIATAETFLLKGRQEAQTGYTARALQSFETSLSECTRSLKSEPQMRSPWKVVADICSELSKMASLEVVGPLLTGCLRPLISIAAEQNVDADLPSINAVDAAAVIASYDNAEEHAYAVPLALSSCYVNKLRVILSASDDHQIGPAWADLAISLSRLAGLQEDQLPASQAISSVKAALNHEPANPTFWLALGNFTFDSSLKVSQHAYIRAIENSVNDATPWSALGLLYLHHGDPELARQCFVQSQTLDPDYAPPWIGQAMESEDSSRATELYGHAVELSEGSFAEADYGFALHALTEKRHDELPSASFALSTQISRHPYDETVLHLSGLVAERLGQQCLSSTRIEAAASLLESVFEQNESPEVATKFAIAQSNLGRVRVLGGDSEGAKQNCETALSLLEVDDDIDLSAVSGEDDISRAIRNAQKMAEVDDHM
ncbi:TPR-like protein [Microstroma glucosiphilum]|uniref:TPR-like protein n=1 Tax=Pseudomicrostroma glucosiphilum TaxID=1684307 RepID=A0A316U1N4_9BASI|nr:TPR-like protein [Pseudomicrostroma glucosiphilum]PWN18353.1 TPR-like protein [Pseudomicrostroma glucosiphilum]